MTGRLVMIAAASMLVVAGIAVAVGRALQNPGFESGFGSWVVKVDHRVGNGIPGDGLGNPNREVVYGPGGTVATAVPCDPDDRYGICVVTGDDTWVTDGTGQTKTVSPRYGTRMLRLAGPYTNPYQRQQQNHRFMVQQRFTVDEATPTVRLRYKLYTYDPLNWRYRPGDRRRRGGRDRLELVVLDSGGDIVRQKLLDTRFNPGEGLDLRATRWTRQRLHLGEYVGQNVTLQIGFVALGDSRGGSWAYVDATLATPRPALTVSLAGTGAGTVTGPGVNCGGDCVGNYPKGQNVVLSATPAAGSKFAGFSGACTGTTCSLTMDANKAVTATFDGPASPPPPPPGSTPDTTAPKITSLSGPKGTLKVKSKKKKAKAKFTFGSDDPNAKFECAVDKGGFKPCTSPFTAKLKVGTHKVSVKATDAVGNASAVSTASAKVKVKKKK